jgi:hypothetical protein
MLAMARAAQPQNRYAQSTQDPGALAGIIESPAIPTLPMRPPSLSLSSIAARSVTPVTRRGEPHASWREGCKAREG